MLKETPARTIWWGIRATALMAVTCFLALGCASVGGDNEQAFDHMITKDTGFFKKGTNNDAPDRQIDRGTRIRLVGMSGEGLMEVQTANGDRGYVDREAIGEIPLPGRVNY